MNKLKEQIDTLTPKITTYLTTGKETTFKVGEHIIKFHDKTKNEFIYEINNHRGVCYHPNSFVEKSDGDRNSMIILIKSLILSGITDLNKTGGLDGSPIL